MPAVVRVQGLGFRVQGLGVQGLGLGYRVKGLGSGAHSRYGRLLGITQYLLKVI